MTKTGDDDGNGDAHLLPRADTLERTLGERDQAFAARPAELETDTRTRAQLPAKRGAQNQTQRGLAGAEAVGPIVQGLNKPYCDLSRGCSVDEMINVAAICSLMA